jgi:hypothetical protein
VKPCKSLRKPALIEAMTNDIPEPEFLSRSCRSGHHHLSP